MKCNNCGLEHEDWLEHTSYEHLGVKACLVSLKRSEVVKAAGTSEGAKKGWEGRKVGFSVPENEHEANHHMDVVEDRGERVLVQHNSGFEHLRIKPQSVHLKSELKLLATDSITTDVIHCRATSSVGPALGASAAWEVGVPVSFMFMPAGTHTITAGFRKGSIELTVQCDESTAKAVQASLDAWRAERPKQQPFGCIEHREHEASVCVSASCGFEWKEDGVYLAAEPTSLGANNVNGKVHRSWSPSFTTDADYAKATEDGGTLRFPEGVRGSRSNPAQITGVDFCVGTLTNRPAFIEMKPVKAREGALVTLSTGEQIEVPYGNVVTAAGTSEGVKKSWEKRKHAMQSDIDSNHPGLRKHVDFSYPSSDNAEHFGFKKGGYSVSFSKDNHPPVAMSMHETREEAMEHAKKHDKVKWSSAMLYIHPELKATDATASAAVHASGGSFNTVLAREADAAAILDKIVARNKPKPVTVDQLNAKFGQTKTGDTRKTPDEILAGIYARAGLSR